MRNGMDIKGDSIITLINGKHVEVYGSDGLGFVRRQSFDAPETVSRYEAPFESFGILFAGGGGAKNVYGVKNAGINAPLFELWFDGAGKNEPALFYGDGDRICLAGKRGGGWYARYLDSRGAAAGEERLDWIGGEETLFASGARERPRLYCFDPGSRLVTIHEKQDTFWRALERAELPAEAPAGGADWDGGAANHPLFLEDRLIPVRAEGGTLLFETGGSRISFMKHGAFHASRNINGAVYWAAHDGGEIALSRIEEAD
jgi:hypothetical protein